MPLQRPPPTPGSELPEIHSCLEWGREMLTASNVAVTSDSHRDRSSSRSSAAATVFARASASSPRSRPSSHVASESAALASSSFDSAASSCLRRKCVMALGGSRPRPVGDVDPAGAAAIWPAAEGAASSGPASGGAWSGAAPTMPRMHRAHCSKQPAAASDDGLYVSQLQP